MINGIGNEIAEIVDDSREGDVVAANVFGEFEEGEDFEEEDERDHNDEEEVEEAAEEIEIKDRREAGVRRLLRDAVFGAGSGGARTEAEAAAKESPESAETGEEIGSTNVAAIALHAREEEESDEGDDDVGGPDADEGRKEPLASEAGAGDEDEVVGGDDDDGEKRAGRAPTATRLRAERNSDEREDKTGRGKGQALIEFDASVAPVGAVIVPELGDRALGIGDGALFGGEHGGKLHGPVGATEGSDGVMIGSGARELRGWCRR